jgi:hypothetical protein
MLTSGRQNTFGAEFSRTRALLRFTGWPVTAHNAERVAIAQLLFRSVQFRAATCLSDALAGGRDGVDQLPGSVK